MGEAPRFVFLKRIFKPAYLGKEKDFPFSVSDSIALPALLHFLYPPILRFHHRYEVGWLCGEHGGRNRTAAIQTSLFRNKPHDSVALIL